MPESTYEALVFAPSESRQLGAAICAHANVALSALEERQFESHEFKLRPLVSVRDREVIAIQSLSHTESCPIAERLVRLLFLLAGLRDAGARRCTALVPYLAYARKDRRTQIRDPINTRYVAELLEAAGLRRLLTLDVHNSTALDNAFRIPVDHFSAIPLFAAHFIQHLSSREIVVLSPDIGGVKRAQLLLEQMQRKTDHIAGLAYIGKRRTGGRVSGDTLVGDVADRTVVIVDDLCATGGTLTRAAQIAKDQGAHEVAVAVTHLPLDAGLQRLLAEPTITHVVATDSVGGSLPATAATERQKLSILSCAPLFGSALARLRSGRSLAPLLESWPPQDE